MNISPALIARRFAKAQTSYACHAHMQKIMAQRLVQQLAYFYPKAGRILEIGCGTGNLTAWLCQQYPAMQVLYANDLHAQSPLACRDLPTATVIHYLPGDARCINLPRCLDAVTANAVLQWLYPLDDFLPKLAAALTVGGALAFSSFGEENFCQIKRLTGQGLSYYTLPALQLLVQQSGFALLVAQQERKVLHFDSAQAVLKHLQATGVTATAPGFVWTREKLQAFCQAYDALAHRQSGVMHYPLTYHALYIIAKKL